MCELFCYFVFIKKEREEDLPYAKGNENERNMITIHTKVISSSVW